MTYLFGILTGIGVCIITLIGGYFLYTRKLKDKIRNSQRETFDAISEGLWKAYHTLGGGGGELEELKLIWETKKNEAGKNLVITMAIPPKKKLCQCKSKIKTFDDIKEEIGTAYTKEELLAHGDKTGFDRFDALTQEEIGELGNTALELKRILLESKAEQIEKRVYKEDLDEFSKVVEENFPSELPMTKEEELKYKEDAKKFDKILDDVFTSPQEDEPPKKGLFETFEKEISQEVREAIEEREKEENNKPPKTKTKKKNRKKR